MPSNRTKYSQEMREQTAKFIIESGKSATSVAEEMERIIARVAEAEREKRAIIVKSEGEVGAAQKLADAAKILSTVPGSMHLRTLATINDLSGDKSNTVIFAIPVEVLESFKTASVVDTVKNIIKK